MDQQLTFFPPPKPLVERFGTEFFRQVPERPGVYLLCGPGDGVLYVGKAKNLRQRLGNYRSANLDRVPRKLVRLLHAVERIEWDECEDEASALNRERELLRALQPRFNSAGVRPAKLEAIGWHRSADGLSISRGELPDGWSRSAWLLPMTNWIHASLLRAVWWTLNPGCGWSEMPRPLQHDKVPKRWQFKTDPEKAEAVERCLELFFAGESPELAEWTVGAAAVRPAFERAWVEQDGLWLFECFERLQATRELSSHESASLR